MKHTLLRWLYQVGVHAYGLALRLAAPFHAKARRWVQGRRAWPQHLAAALGGETGWIWVHCASLGEFEQGRNLIDALHAQPDRPRVLVTFFSPSGYAVRHAYPRAGHVAYLPLDTRRQVRRFLDLVQPRLAIFVKYELWLNYLDALHARQVPTVLLSARMGPESAFLRGPLAPLYRQALGRLAHIFVQDAGTAQRLRPWVDPARLSVSGDTRYDRVRANQAQFAPVPEIEAWLQGRPCLVGGSTWPRDEALLLQAFERLRTQSDLCLILAPHEIDPGRIAATIAQDPEIHRAYSAREGLRPHHRILWIDNIGLLARLYHYAEVAYVGGAWGSGLHNILEAAVYGCPVLFGPRHQRFPEAAALIAAGGAFAITDADSLVTTLDRLLQAPDLRQDIRQRNQAFVAGQAGATERVWDWGKKQGFW